MILKSETKAASRILNVNTKLFLVKSSPPETDNIWCSCLLKSEHLLRATLPYPFYKKKCVKPLMPVKAETEFLEFLGKLRWHLMASCMQTWNLTFAFWGFKGKTYFEPSFTSSQKYLWVKRSLKCRLEAATYPFSHYSIWILNLYYFLYSGILVFY